MNFFLINIPIIYLLFLAILAQSNWFVRNLDLALSSPKIVYDIIDENDSKLIESLHGKRVLIATLANLYSTAHLVFYLAYAFIYNIFSSILLSILVFICVMVLSFLEPINPKHKLGVICLFISPLVLIVLFYLLFRN
jgi:hypothetical protein